MASRSGFTVSVLMPVWNQEELVVRALESIPENVDEIIVIDDGSTDNTAKVLAEMEKRDPRIRLFTNSKNRGVGYTINRCYNLATCDYTVILSSDDYFHPEMKDVIEELDGSDMVFFNLTYNVKSRNRRPNQRNYRKWAGSCKLVRREFMGDIRASEAVVNEDKELYEKLLRKNPTVKFTDIFGKHYNTPREGSLTDLKQKGYFGKHLVTVGTERFWAAYNAELGVDKPEKV